MSFQKDYEDYLMHHGVKGMKWGVRNNRFKTSKKRKLHSRILRPKFSTILVKPTALNKPKAHEKLKAHLIKERQDYIDSLKSQYISDFRDSEENYLAEIGRLDKIAGLGNDMKKWETYRQEVIKEEERKLNDLKYW